VSVSAGRSQSRSVGPSEPRACYPSMRERSWKTPHPSAPWSFRHSCRPA
jgi:hypothetical protein